MSNISKNFSEEDSFIQDNEVINLNEEIEDKEPDEGELEWKEDDKIFHDAQEDRLSRRREEEQLDIKKEIRSWIFTLAITFVLIFVLKNYVIINAMVPTGSMENTIMPDDQLFGNRLAYLFDEPERGDIIFFYYPDDESQKFVKRVIGLPGEKVTIIDAKVYIDDSEVPLDEPYLKEEWIYGVGPYEFQVPEGCYFVMGDNRNTSQDARYWKNTYVAKEKIIGEAVFIYYPFHRMGVVE
ncbi:MAG: signal peptidase I [Agathobacter sp.]|nr:signal peptidase I [Agathobacter sp.]